MYLFCSMASDTRSATGSASRESNSAASVDHQLQSKAYLSPSDTSIDESVKSAQAGKDVLEQYLKKSKASSLKLSAGGSAQAPTTSSINDLIDPSSVVGSPPPPLTLPSAHHHYFKSDCSHSSLIRPGSGSFGHYYSSPKYPTPPLPSSESILGSPIPDYSQKFYHQYDNPPGPQAPTSSQPHSLTSVSPTSGVRNLLPTH